MKFKKRKIQSITFTFRCPKKMKTELAKISRDTDRHISSIIRKFLREKIDEFSKIQISNS